MENNGNKGTQSQLKISNGPQQQRGIWKPQYMQKKVVGKQGNSVDPRGLGGPAEVILVANKEGLDIIEKEIRDTRNETLGNVLEDIRETSKETTKIAIMVITNGQPEASAMEKTNDQSDGPCLLNNQISLASDSTFFVDHDYIRVGNSGTSLDDDRGLYCANEPHDKGFHSDVEVTTNLACVEIDSINLQVEDYKPFRHCY
ncbi:unnamed protein product [Ilex paraguariensis]|uniref:Uncharacterized protein n=2 Tax=Ilex paraguariensis TaxID=185542 RepID=A0ABC8RSQ3_9AQUA